MRRSRCFGEHRLLINRVIAIIASGFAASLAGSAASAQPTLNNVKNKGFLTCGSNGAFAGFSFPDVHGNWTGLDTELCRDRIDILDEQVHERVRARVSFVLG